MASNNGPTYEELFKMMTKVERTALHTKESTAKLLKDELSHHYPHITISRPGRFLDTVRRITAPIQHSRILKGTSLQSYLKRQWSPRIRNMNVQCMCIYNRVSSTYKDIVYSCMDAPAATAEYQ